MRPILLPRKRVFFDWDELIEYIADKKVIPVCGWELVEIDVDGKRENLMQYLARRAAGSSGIEVDLSFEEGEFTLGDVIYSHLAHGGEIGEIYRFIGKEIAGLSLAAPEALLKLARIRSFDLFVSTTFDSFLTKALNQVRFGGREGTLELAFPNKRSQEPDLPCPRSQLRQPVVYHLFGRHSTSRNFAVTEADLLEYVSSLQDDDCRPERLFLELQDSHLLFLGTGHQGWFSRFLLRIIRNMPLSADRCRHELFVERSLSEDQGEVLFLDRFSRDSKVNSHGDAVQFVDELFQRISETRPDLLADAPAAPPASGETLPELEDGAIFLSYASEDRPAVTQLCEQLTAAGVPVWMDRKGGIPSGDFEWRIKRGIERASIFLPIFSATIIDPRTFDNRYFRREWDHAINRLMPGAAPGVIKVQPVRIDSAAIPVDLLPERFRSLHHLEAPDGRLSDTDLQEIVSLYRAWVRRNRDIGR